MKKYSAIACAVGAAILCSVPASIQWSPEKTLSLSIDTAAARIGRPLTPLSVAGVARRTARRTVRRNVYYGAHHYRPY